jgi:hypothetical protein
MSATQLDLSHFPCYAKAGCDVARRAVIRRRRSILTVKICRRDGSESLFEAMDVTKEPGGLLIQREGDTQFWGRGGLGYCLDWDGRQKEPEPAQVTASVFVMNRHGATVATYSI